jgi:hypothetical protein
MYGSDCQTRMKTGMADDEEELTPKQWRSLEELIDFLRPFYKFVVSFQVRVTVRYFTPLIHFRCFIDQFAHNRRRLSASSGTGRLMHNENWRFEWTGDDQIDAGNSAAEKDEGDDGHVRRLLHTAVFMRNLFVAEVGTAHIAQR